jgi:hypothetical protein
LRGRGEKNGQRKRHTVGDVTKCGVNPGRGFQQYQAIIKDDYRCASLEILNPGKEGIRQAYIVGECQPPVDDGFESS